MGLYVIRKYRMLEKFHCFNSKDNIVQLLSERWLNMAAHFIEENSSLATELLHELKLSAKRWFIAFCVMVFVEVATIAGFLWYISLPVEDYTIEQTADQLGNTIDGDGTITQTTGG